MPSFTPHAGLVGDDARITGIGLGLSTVGVARPIHGEAWDVEDSLVSLPQQCQQECRAASRLIP
jgi:hypothetical protein